MSENAPVETNPVSAPNNPPPPQNENQSVSLNTSQAINVCAAALLGCFFLPWIRFFLGRPSGCDFAKEGGIYVLFWAVPIFSVLTILAGIMKRGQKVAARTTGELPFLILGFGVYKLGTDLFQAIEIGGYATLGLGVVLFILSRKVK